MKKRKADNLPTNININIQADREKEITIEHLADIDRWILEIYVDADNDKDDEDDDDDDIAMMMMPGLHWWHWLSSAV